LGNQPPSNSFIKKEDIKNEAYYPLEVVVCEDCYLSQLNYVVSPHIIFDDYVYLSSSSKALVQHYASLAEKLTAEFKLKKDDLVVDIGCNDGILLHGYSLKGLKKVGVEPSSVAQIAIDSGLDVLKEFFNQKTAKEIIKSYGKAQVITTTNVFAHVDDIHEFVKGIALLLDENGVFVIEAPYLIDMFEQTLFDTIYHEHLCYLSLTPMVPFFQKFGLEITNVERISFGASGPAIRVFVSNKNTRKIQSAVNQMLKDEINWGIKEMNKYNQFANDVENIKKEVLSIIQKIKKERKKIGAFGAPAKGNTLLNYFEITPEIIPYVAENNHLKQGMLTPGSHIPIISDEEFLEKMPDIALLLTWNYVNFFLEKSEYIKKGGKFLVPLPKPQILP
jgi:SAM-dependent methyltransferase